jgi:hypothetical protein
LIRGADAENRNTLHKSFLCLAVRILLITESVHPAAIGALPGDMVAGHAPDIFLHACLADGEPAAAAPTEPEDAITAVALLLGGPPAAAVSRF